MDTQNTTIEAAGIDTTIAWKEYNEKGSIQRDQMLLTMLGEVIHTIHSLEKIYGNTKSSLVVRAMLADYVALNNIAFHRNLPNLPTLV